MTTAFDKHIVRQHQETDSPDIFCKIGSPVALNACMRSAIVEHLQALTSDDCYDRFAISMRDDVLVRYVSNIDFKRDICFGIFEARYGLIGMIHLSVHGPVAELGASVSNGFRGRGVGLAIFRSAFNAAINIGIREIHLATGHPAACRISQCLGYSIRKGGDYPKAIIALD